MLLLVCLFLLSMGLESVHAKKVHYHLSSFRTRCQNLLETNQQKLDQLRNEESLTPEQKKEKELAQQYVEVSKKFKDIISFDDLEDAPDEDIENWIGVFNNVLDLVQDAKDAPPPITQANMLAYARSIAALKKTCSDYFTGTSPEDAKNYRIKLLTQALGLEKEDADHVLRALTKIWESPLVIDLNRDGQVSLLNPEQHAVYFDLNGNGTKRNTGWIGPQEALLAIDKNKNGLIDNGSELFGNNSKHYWNDTNSKNGFEALRKYDKDGNNLINSKDPIYDIALCWNDRNSNGISEREELKPLKECGIKNISLVYQPTPLRRTHFSNERRFSGTYKGFDNRRYKVVDIWFVDVIGRRLNKAISKWSK